MTTATLTLTEFLLARIAEDAAAAEAGISGQADPENGWGLIETQGFAGLSLSPHVGHIHERIQGEHIIRWHPARVLAECEAKRRIVGSFSWYQENAGRGTASFDALLLAEAHAKRLAEVYADHPDYRPEWRP